ncbi:hypothetical protein [Rugamonas rubra]|uniref:hypothetical protein n=1 Tax=Rugamonas rubra TaxID=758825 RepID=UPI001581426A|nr:hypothetical protein [Rugamonas rubra]
MYLEPYQFEPLLLTDRQLLEVQAMAEHIVSASLRWAPCPSTSRSCTPRPACQTINRQKEIHGKQRSQYSRSD